MPVVSDFENQWFSKHLRAANEPSLFATTSSIRAAGQTVLRFTWLRTFHHPVIVRVSWSRDRQPVLTTVELTGAGGYDPGKVKRTTTRNLNPVEIEALHAAIDAAHLGSVAPRACDFGFDGSEWIFETVNKSGYRAVIRWTPAAGEVRRLGLTLLRLSRWRFGDARDIY